MNSNRIGENFMEILRTGKIKISLKISEFIRILKNSEKIRMNS
jgi:hypothetical protein